MATCVCALAGFCLLRKPQYKKILEKQSYYSEKNHFLPLKISGFTRTYCPKIEVEIENHIISSEIDLGWGGGIALPSTIFHNLRNKSFISHSRFTGLRGKIYHSDIYEIPHIYLGNTKIFPMRIKEESLEFLEDGILKSGKKEIPEPEQGRVGWYVFKPFNLLLDCEHSAIAMCDSLATLKEQGFPIDSFIETTLLLDRDSINFEVTTDAGRLRCMLDTGSSWNYLNKDLDSETQDHRIIRLNDPEQPLTFNPENEDLLVFNSKDTWNSQTLQINGNEFGPVTFTKMKSPLDFDAILGMEFIEDHLIFIDFGNKKIYFSKLPEDRSLLVRAYDFALDKIKKALAVYGL